MVWEPQGARGAELRGLIHRPLGSVSACSPCHSLAPPPSRRALPLRSPDRAAPYFAFPQLAEPIDYLAKNIADLPVAPEPKPLPEWYLASIPQPSGPVYAYSGQRLNQTDVQKEALRATLATLHRKGAHMTYNRQYLWADSIGDSEERKGYAKPDAHLKPWDPSAPAVYNKDGTLSSYRMLQVRTLACWSCDGEREAYSGGEGEAQARSPPMVLCAVHCPPAGPLPTHVIS